MSTNSVRTDVADNTLHTGPQNRPVRRVIRPAELGEIEGCLESVVVPGELTSWATSLWQACQTEGPALRREIVVNHADQLAKVSNEDTNLAQRVAQMQTEDAEILKLYDDFEGRVRRMQDRAVLAGAREDKFDEGIRALIDEGLSLVIRVRKQERALSTWFAEAFQRDTGVGD